MAKYKETCDLYDDEGKLLKSGVTLDKISPLINPGCKKIIDLTKRTVAVNLAGIDNALKTGKIGKDNQILGRSIKADVVKDVDALSDKIKAMVQVTDGDDTKITKVGGGKMLLVEVPSARLECGRNLRCGITSVAAATTYAIIDQYKVGMFDGAYVKSGVWGTYPQTMDMQGGNIVSILSIPQNNEGLGYALRNIPANHVGDDDPPERDAGRRTLLHLRTGGRVRDGHGNRAVRAGTAPALCIPGPERQQHRLRPRQEERQDRNHRHGRPERLSSVQSRTRSSRPARRASPGTSSTRPRTRCSGTPTPQPEPSQPRW